MAGTRGRGGETGGYEQTRLGKTQARTREDFLSLVSHDLRTPLNAIGGYAALLEMELSGPLDPTQSQHVAGIQENLARLTATVNALLSLSMLQSREVEFVVADHPVSAILADLEEDFRGFIEGRSLVLDILLQEDGGPLVVRADGHKVARILSEVLSNALKFSSSGGRITISGERQGDMVAIAVSDTGTGIPQEELQNVFEPFVRLRPHTLVAPGPGLGLAIGRMLARGMAGDLQVRSIRGQGSTFTLVLPASRRMG